VSVYVNDTESTVGVQTFDINGVLVDSCANVFSGCSVASVTGNRALLTFTSPIAELRFTDAGGDGHVIDDLVYTLFE